jgi:hypothetical protein
MMQRCWSLFPFPFSLFPVPFSLFPFPFFYLSTSLRYSTANAR